MTVTGSTDISILEVKTTLDLSGVNPIVRLENLSEGDNLDDVKWWFSVTSPNGTPIKRGIETSPDITGTWVDKTLSGTFPKPNKQIEWSGAPYAVAIHAKDASGNVYFITKLILVERPNGSTAASSNHYGVAKTDVRVSCHEGLIYFEDQTNYSYKSLLTGTRVSSVLRVVYPINDTNTIPPPFTSQNFSRAAVPITYSHSAYQFVVETVMDYDLGDFTHVVIKYQTKDPKTGLSAVSFPVLCNIDLAPLGCSILKLIDELPNSDCGPQETNKNFSIIYKYLLASIGTLQPLSGIDVPGLVAEIQETGGFDCDCFTAPNGIVKQTASVIDGYTFAVVKEGGDIDGTIGKDGKVIQIKLHDRTYNFGVCAENGSAAMIVKEAVTQDGFVKNVCFDINNAVLASELAVVIKGNVNLVNAWNEALGNAAGIYISVDGGKVFITNTSCDFTFLFRGIPAANSYALLTGIKVGAITTPLSHTFNLANATGIAAYLNTLGFGNFTVSIPNPNPNNTILITTENNVNDITSLNYKVGGISYAADISRNCNGFVARTVESVVQDIITYISNLNDSQVITSEDYDICFLDDKGEIKATTIEAGTNLSAFLRQLTEAGCSTIKYLTTSSVGLTCESIKNLFQKNVQPITSQDFILGTRGDGSCSQIGFSDAFNFMLESVKTNQTTKDAFCAAMESCGQGEACEPFEYLEFFMTDYSTTCVPIVGIQYVIT